MEDKSIENILNEELLKNKQEIVLSAEELSVKDDKVGDLEPEENTKISNVLKDDSVAIAKYADATSPKFEEEGDISVEADNESLSSLAMFQSKDSLFTAPESYKELSKYPSSEDVKEHLREPEDAMSAVNTHTEKAVSDNELNTPQSLNRIDVIEHCRSLLSERKQLMLKNILLQKKLYDYFKKKKAEGMYHEGESILDGLGEAQAELLYRKNLLVFEDMVEKSANEKARIDLESKELFQEKNELLNTAAEQVDFLLKQEEIYGNGLISSISGKPLQDKVVLSLINRHKEMIKNLTVVMLKYIRVRDAVSEKEAAINSLEDLGEGLHLIDYELLCIEKQDLQNKIEERDSDLNHLREKIETSIVALSHINEKIYNSDELIERNLHQLDELNYLAQLSREKKTKAKKQHINLRSDIEHLQNEAGLLVHHVLLRDLENVMMQIAEVKHEMNQMKRKLCGKKLSIANNESKASYKLDRVNSTSSQLNYPAACRTIKELSLDRNEKKDMQKSQIDNGADHPKICKGRPSIDRFLAKT